MASTPHPEHQHRDQAAATDVYVFGYALIMMELTRQLQTNTVKVNATQAPTNQFCQWTAPPTPEMKDVVRPNVDTLYSLAWIDLAAEPMVLAVPVMEPGRYWLMQLMDAWSNTSFKSPSSIAPLGTPTTDPSSGAEVYAYALTGPGWEGELPDDVHHVPMETDTVWLLGRIELFGLDDEQVSAVTAYQDLMRLLPLSAWPDNGTYVPPDGTYDPAVSTAPPSELINALSGPDFFARLIELLPSTPLNPADPVMSATLAELGVYPYDPARLPDAQVLDRAKEEGLTIITQHQGPDPINGWAFAKTDIGYYGTDYVQRAYVALIGLGANLPEDALYPSTGGQSTDSTGKPIRYTLTFPAGQLPPVNAFWSLTAYDAESFLVANPAEIYAVGHFTPPCSDPDTGATTLYLSAVAPEDDSLPRTNWLPIPTSGKFSVTLRLYAPQTNEIPDDWPPALTEVRPQD
ncbi:DUF1254 domain-containing protein [Kitasatospora sp. NPDC098652]|uniref:DUF1254 domain-containing protein n=1 Tax=Kitasatospora sp. NPDC098652 TaxID=3364095 RepID=UPI0038295C35